MTRMKTMMTGLMAGTAALLLSGCSAPMYLSGTLTGAQESPATASRGTGTVTATVYPSTNAMSYKIEYAGLSGPATAAHFHGPASPGANAGVVVPFASAATPVSGSANLTDAQKADVMAGKWYANVHTAANPGGEIRGQLMPAPMAR